jgi:hypothetical protein
MADSGEALSELQDDNALIRLTSQRLTETVHKSPEIIENAVRDELEQRRKSARIQTFVPIFAERAARRRLAG